MSPDEVIAQLSRLRDKIDGVDERLVALLNERTAIVEQIGRAKRGASMPVYEPQREDEVFRNIAGSNRGPLSQEALRRIFERIIDEMRTVQRERMSLEKDAN